MTNTLRNKRQTNYELLRISSILIISFMHGIKSAYGSPCELNSILFVAINAIGNMGVTIFILISGYFSIKYRLSKLFQLWAIVLFYSVLIFLFNNYIYPGSVTPDFLSKDFIKALYTTLTPITSGTWWFITSYTVLFMLSPLLNKATKKMSKYQFKYLLLVLLLFYSISPTFLMHSLSDTPNGKCTENMILAYLLGRYIYYYGLPSTLMKNSGKILICCLTLIFIINYFIFDPLFMAKDHNLFIILGAICIFTIFKGITIKSDRVNRFICHAATFAFPIYILNMFLIDLLEYQYIELRTSYSYIPYYLMVQIEVIIISVFIEYIRRSVCDKPINFIGKMIDIKTELIINRLTKS